MREKQNQLIEAGVLTTLTCLILTTAVFGQEADKPKGANFDSYQFSQFISAAGQSPQQVTKLNNNGEILLACVERSIEDVGHSIYQEPDRVAQDMNNFDGLLQTDTQ